MINKIVIFSLVIVLFVVGISWITDNDNENNKPGALPRNEPDIYMLNASIEQFDKLGDKQHTINVARFTHFPLTDITTMQQPTMVLGQSGASIPWKITANEGRILPSSQYREEVIELWESVLAEQTQSDGKFVNIQTSSLTVFPAKDYAETDEKVFIDNQNGRTTAAGMKAHLDQGRFIFYSTPADRVTTILLPNLRGLSVDE